MFFYTTLSAYSKLLMLIGELAVMYIESHCPDNSTDNMFKVLTSCGLIKLNRSDISVSCLAL